MTDKEVVERGQIYRELYEHPGWKKLLEEVTEVINSKTNNIMETFVGSDDGEKGIVKGMKSVLQYPIDAMTEMDELLRKETANQAKSS